jgi:hypothetical protein
MSTSRRICSGVARAKASARLVMTAKLTSKMGVLAALQKLLPPPQINAIAVQRRIRRVSIYVSWVIVATKLSIELRQFATLLPVQQWVLEVPKRFRYFVQRKVSLPLYSAKMTDAI